MLLSRENLIEDSLQAVNVRALPALLGRQVCDGANNLAFDRNGGIAAVLLSFHLRQPKTTRPKCSGQRVTNARLVNTTEAKIDPNEAWICASSRRDHFAIE